MIPMRFRSLMVAAGALVLACTAAACTTAHGATPPSSTTRSSIPRTTTTTAGTTTTTVYTASAPQTSPDAAGNLLINDWAQGNRAAAASVATPAAVSALFAAAYPGSGLAIDRGCGDTPVVCSFGPPGGADPSDALYQLTMAQTPAGWYVSSVMVES
jgi:hypothetical protein